MKKFLFFIFIFSIALSSSILNTQRTNAVTAADWKPGRIIDDVVFQNQSSMTVAQIQQFLDSKVPTCDTWGTKPMWSGGPTRAQWSIDNGKDTAPYTCLKEYVENPATKANNASDPRTVVAGGLSAAQLIYNASQAQNINPQVFLVLLQKEQSLVTDDWPYASQFEKATGNNCPDTAPCNPVYAWLWTQVNNAGAQFNYYVNNFDQYNYAPGWNNILYNPDTSCGRQSVYIENKYTAALYIYTPYVPNQAALNNMYGTGDSCSAYGNRNFWRLFSDWFGSTYAPNFSASYQWQNFSPFMSRGSVAGAIVQYKNTGNQIWEDGKVNLATTGPINRSSIFGNSWSGSNNRPAINFTAVYEADGITPTSDQKKVLPGQIVRFMFNITVPTNVPEGTYTEYFQPVLEGASNWNIGGLVWFTIQITKTNFSASYVSQSQYPVLPQGSEQTAFIRLRNTGNGPWRNDFVKGISAPLLTRSPFSSSSIFSSKWITNSVASTFSTVYDADGIKLSTDQKQVNPNQIAEFRFNLFTPIDAPGSLYRENFKLFINNNSPHLIGPDMWIDISVPASFSRLTYKSQSPYPRLSPGQSYQAFFMFTNSGTTTLYDTLSSVNGRGQANLATTNIINRISIFGNSWPVAGSRPSLTFDSVYESDGTTLAQDQHRALPGQIIKYAFTITVPATTKSGLYREFFQPVLEGAGTWNVGGLVWLDITIN